MNKLLTLFSALLMLIVQAFADTAESQLDERLNPVFESEEIDYGTYPNIHRNKNVIGLNGDDWSALGEKYSAAMAGDSLFTVIYLGDSHIQADFGGSVLRSCLQGGRSAGRGLIIPFRLAGTNQPNDYSLGMSSAYLTSKLMRLPWSTEMPFTGIGLQPVDNEFTLTLKSQDPATVLRFHLTSGSLSPVEVNADGENVKFEAFTDGDDMPCVRLPHPASEINIRLKGNDNPVTGGVELLSADTGILVHSIGNNGATYSDYSLSPHFGSELARLHPDLIVIALGTNEAFGNTSVESLRNNIDNLLSTIRRHNPDAKLLLVGPADCYRRLRRTRRRSSRQVVNTKVATVARAIRLYAEENGIPYYNHFAVAGNAPTQRKAGLFSRDGVHYTMKGYQLWGHLLSDAILKAMKP